jgi:hypothetical protein
MPARTSWSNLFPGILALAAIALVAVGVLVFAGVGRVRGEKIRLYVLTDQARGVMRGSDVWLEGQKVGVVRDVTFRAPSADSAGRLVIAFDVRKRDAGQIRQDSRAQVRAGANIIGPVVLYLDAGTPAHRGVGDGDTLRARPQSDMEAASAKLSAAAQNVDPIMANVRGVIGHVKSSDGTVGALLHGGIGTEIARLRGNVSRAMRRSTNGNGHASSGPSAVMVGTRGALARVDSIRALLNSPRSSFGRFRRDSTLTATVAGVRDELAALRARLAGADGSLGRFETDSAITRSVAAAQLEMARLVEDIRKRPLRYVHF